MAKRIISRAVMTGMLLGAFGLGYLCGSVSWQLADAQDLGAEADFRAVFHNKG